MEKIVLCGGCFNVIHEGHIFFLQRARALGSRLVVVVASDVHNKKPYARSAAVRARAVRSLGLADKVIIGSSRSFLSTVSKVKPQVIALGYDQTLPADIADELNTLAIKVKRIPRYKRFSTSALHKVNAKSSFMQANLRFASQGGKNRRL
jgi:cytidyltransferase-like protein